MANSMLLLVLAIALFSSCEAAVYGVVSTDKEDVHYSIQDIIGRYKNFTSTKREISLFNEHPEFDTSCIREALSPILSQCMKKPVSEIDQKQRSISAVKLSICEFEVAQIQYPQECQYVNMDYSLCLSSIEKRSQWWTSYSGYYRSIGEICHQERLPYEKDMIWDMFMDVTDTYEKILNSLNDYVVMTEDFQKQSNEGNLNMMKFMEEMINTTKLNKETNDFMWNSIRDQLSKISELSLEVTDLTIKKTSSIENNLLKFLNNVNSQYSESIELLRDKFLDELQEKDDMVLQSIEEIRLNLMSLNLVTKENQNLSMNLNENLQVGIENTLILNQTITEVDNNVYSLNEDVQNVQSLIVNITDILDTNPLVRTILYTSSQITTTFESFLLFISMGSLLFFCLNCLGNLEFFKFIGIGLFALIGSVLFLYAFIYFCH